MAEYIERDALLKVLRGSAVAKYPASFAMGLFAAADEVSKLPAADVVPVVRGRWAYDEAEMECYCSVCGHNAQIGMSSYILHKYCPNCGAHMRDGE